MTRLQQLELTLRLVRDYHAIVSLCAQINRERARIAAEKAQDVDRTITYVPARNSGGGLWWDYAPSWAVA